MQVINSIKKYLEIQQKEYELIDRDLKELQQKEKDLSKNLNVVKKQKDKAFKKRRDLIKQLEELPLLISNLESKESTTYLQSFNRLLLLSSKDKQLKEAFGNIDELKIKAAKIKMSVGTNVRSLCKERGLTPVDGDEGSGFKINGLYTVTINWEKTFSYIGTLAQKNQVKVNSVDPEEIINQLELVKRNLERSVPETNKFLRDLINAYQKLANKVGEDILLEDIRKLIDLKPDVLSLVLGKLISNLLTTNIDGMDLHFSSGHGGIAVYDANGAFRTYKFLRIKKRN